MLPKRKIKKYHKYKKQLPKTCINHRFVTPAVYVFITN